MKTINFHRAELSESRLERNIGSMQKGEEASVFDSWAGMMVLLDQLETLEPGQALVVFKGESES